MSGSAETLGLEVNLKPENVPDRLKGLDQWVNWRGEWSEEKRKLNKVPKRWNGWAASSTDEKTWSTFEKAVGAVGTRGLDGIGFAGLGRTDYVGVDLDHCLDPKTGAITQHAAAIVQELGSYTEISPSRTGLRIWVEAEKAPGSWCANKEDPGGETEVYSQGRFFTVTGWHLEGTPKTIESRQAEFDAFMERHAPPERPKPPKPEYTGDGEYRLDLTEFLEEFGVEVLRRISDANSEAAYGIVCPWAHEHTAGDTSGTRVGQYPSGGLWFHCDHGHCDGRKWEHFREELDPEAYRRVEITVGGRKLSDEEEAARSAERAEAAWTICEDLAGEPDILADFERHQRRAGVAGEGKLLRLIYLALTSRVLDRPVSFVVKGPSSGGKTYLVESTLTAFPEDAYIDLTGMSEKALIYAPYDYRHRFLYIPEAAGVNHDYLDYLIRTLLSEHRIKYLTVESVNGKIVPREVIKEGPTGLVMATTRAYLHPENETRLLSLRVDDSAEHTRAVLLAVAGRDSAEPADYRTWRSLQTWIAGQDNRVAVPYAGCLAGMIPPVDLRVRRDFELLLNAVKSHAILHQATHERDGDGRIVATLGDYAAVRALVGDVMSAAVATRVPPQLRKVVSAVAKLLKDEESPSTANVRRATGFSKSQAAHWLKTAKGEGYLIDANEGKRGKAAELSVGAALPAATDLLPTVEALRAEWDGTDDDPSGDSVRASGVSGAGAKDADSSGEEPSGQPSGRPSADPDASASTQGLREEDKPTTGSDAHAKDEADDPVSPAGHPGQPDGSGSDEPDGRFGQPTGWLAGRSAHAEWEGVF